MSPGRWCLLVALALLGMVVVWRLDAPERNDNPQYDALVAAHSRAIKARDSVKTVASEAVKQNVIARRPYTAAKAALPPAFVKILEDSATIHLNTETYTVQRPVAEYVLSLQHALTLADSALVASDSALAKTQQVVAASESVEAVSDSIVAILQENPSFLTRAWRRIETPVKVIGGFVLGWKAAKL